VTDPSLAVSVIRPPFALAGLVSLSHGRNQVPDVSKRDMA
jgi:hypothetical protein